MMQLPLSEHHIQLLAATPQRPKYHAEGNVYIHTCRVLESYLAYKAENEVSEEEHTILYWACILHDIGKPKVTRWVNAGWSARGHEEAGVSIARNILLQRPEITSNQRMKILDLVRWHYIPLRWMIDNQPFSQFQQLATQTDLRLIGLFAQFDIEGRECADKERIKDLCKKFSTEIVPRIEAESGSFAFMKYQYEGAALQLKNAIWRAYTMPHPTLWAKLLRSENAGENKADFHCIMTIGVAKCGKTSYVQKKYPDAYHLSTKGWDINAKLSDDPYEKQRILTIIKHHLSVYTRYHKQIVMDGENLYFETRKEIIDIVKELKGKVTYLFFDSVLDSILENHPQEKEKIKADYEILRYPHPWEAHEMHVID